MDDRKLRIAFAKVKKDIIGVQEDLYDLAKEQANGNNNGTNNQAYHDQLKFDNFVTNVENELKALTLFTKELEDRISHIQTSKPVKSVSMPQSSIENKDLEDNLIQLESKFLDFTELINEKVDMEINSLRLEFTEEIAKVYDRVFTEVLDLKEEISSEKISKNSNSKKKVPKKQTVKKIPEQLSPLKTKKKVSKKQSSKKLIEDELYQPISEQTEKPGKLKKVMNWLFVDEEEDNEISDIKSEVKKVKDEDKEDLY